MKDNFFTMFYQLITGFLEKPRIKKVKQKEFREKLNELKELTSDNNYKKEIGIEKSRAGGSSGTYNSTDTLSKEIAESVYGDSRVIGEADVEEAKEVHTYAFKCHNCGTYVEIKNWIPLEGEKSLSIYDQYITSMAYIVNNKKQIGICSECSKLYQKII